MTKQKDLLVETYGDKGREIVADAQAYADGINAYWKANNINEPPATVNDVLAVTAFIGSIFGAGGGGEAANGELLAKLQASLGSRRGYKAWEDVMLADDPEAPTTINRRFDYGPLTGGKKVTGSVTIDPGSIQAVDPRTTTPAAAAAAPAPPAGVELPAGLAQTREARQLAGGQGPAAGLLLPRDRAADAPRGSRHPSPRESRCRAWRCTSLIGRTENYAWSLTSAGHDVRDVYAERLCEPNGSAPTRASTHYLYKGECRALVDVNAGLLSGTPIKYKQSVHGNVVRDRHDRRQAVCAVAQAVDVRP